MQLTKNKVFSGILIYRLIFIFVFYLFLIILLKANEMASLMCVIYTLDIRYARELVDNVDILVNLLIPENFAM